MKFYDLSFDEQVEELDEVWWKLQETIHEMKSDNPFYLEILDTMNRIHDEKNRIKEKIPKDNTDEYLLNEYKRSVL